MTDNLRTVVGSLGLGAGLSALISWYFFRMSVHKNLSIYIQFASPVLAGVADADVRKALQITYRGTKIDDILQLQFVVANEGQRAIRDLIEPLNLVLPKQATLLEATILHVEPKGREVSIGSIENPDGRTRVEFRFKLLNKREFFFVKMLINGKLDADALQFNIAVDDLPPIIAPKHQPFQTAEEEPITGLGAMLLGLIPLALCVATIFGMVELGKARSDFFPGHQHFAWLSLSTLGILLGAGSASYWLVRSTQLIVARGLFGRKHKFRLPRPTSRAHYPEFYGGSPYFEPELLEHLRTLPPSERNRLIRVLRMQQAQLDVAERSRE